ncbi:MAG: hypothetical protein NT129_03800 [Candidatus Aenigmarchaeota archaeon]|nr:hypothetical protein [Candidatus Aenigmarchaeota archaeon]
MSDRIFFHRNYEHMNDHNSGIVRRDMYFCRTADVPLPEYSALLTGFQKIINETGRRIKIHDFGNYNLGKFDYGSPDWYQEHALTKRERGLGRQVSAVVIDKLLREEPFQKQKPHFDVMIVDKDLTTYLDEPENRFIFGLGPYPNNIISVKRFIHNIKDPRLRKASLAVLGAHEFGHNLDLVRRNFNIGTEGYKISHCNGEKGPCLMEQVNVDEARNIDEQAKLIIDKDKWLCPDCTDEIQFKRDDLRKKGVYW